MAASRNWAGPICSRHSNVACVTSRGQLPRWPLRSCWPVEPAPLNRPREPASMSPASDGERWDAVVVGAGPGGSIAALVLARAGARVALIDKAAFPRAKACGDLIGPRGGRVLQELGVSVPDAGHGADLLVVGPSGHRSRLPAFPGRSYAGHGIVVPRLVFDDALRSAAIAAGAPTGRGGGRAGGGAGRGGGEAGGGGGAPGGAGGGPPRGGAPPCPGGGGPGAAGGGGPPGG